jgi:aryl-alcohol dehydrogenase-like predicted oxidoreductase
MEYRRLGTTGLKVSAVGLGAQTFGGTADEALSIGVVQKAMELGVTHIDTADSYGDGLSEVYLGKAVQGHRHELVIGTKLAVPTSDQPNDRGLSRRYIMAATEASLKRLNMEYVDLLYAHRFDPTTPIEESARAFDDLVKQGKVRYIGCSNWQAWQLAQGLGIQERLGLARWVVIQPSWNIVEGLDDPALGTACEALGVGIIPYSPMGRGVLTGKYVRGVAPPPGTRFGDRPAAARMLTEPMFNAVDVLRPWAETRGHTVGQLAVAWLLAHDVVSSVIVGARRPEQVVENAGAGDWRLTPAERDEVHRMVHGS